MVDEPTPNCLCEPTPRVWPDTNTGTHSCLDTDEYTTFLTKRFDEVATLNQASDDARRETSLAMDVHCEQLEQTKELEAANDELENRMSALTAENKSILKGTLELTEELNAEKLSNSSLSSPCPAADARTSYHKIAFAT